MCILCKDLCLLIMCFSKQEIPTLFDNLERPLDFSSIDHSLWNDKCDYYEVDEIQNLNPNNKKLNHTSAKYKKFTRKAVRT